MPITARFMRPWSRRWRFVVGALAGGAALAATGLPRPARAEWLLPLVTEDPLTIPSGTADVMLGASYSLDPRFPLFTVPGSVHSENLVAAPEIGLRIAAGSRVEIQAGFEMLYLDAELANGQTQSNYGAGDATLSTKVRLFEQSGWRPAVGIRFGTKLPNANRSEGLGTDETDFAIEALGSEHFGPVTAYLNLGIALLGVPGPIFGVQPGGGNGRGQDDLFTYGVALASEWLGRVDEGAWGCRFLGEVVGQTGSRFDNDRAAIRGGVQVRHAALTLYTGVSGGLESGSETFGVGLGAFYAFELERLFGWLD